ncbi:MAG TPA: hypothetical protein VIL36_21160, partial [Acidimicrobiales bacterium]
MLDRCRREERWATPDEQAVLARWAAWGAIPQLFNESVADHADSRARVRELLGSDEAWEAARTTTLNA